MSEPEEGAGRKNSRFAALLSNEQQLRALLRRLVKGLVVVLAIFAVVYFFGQRQNHVPNVNVVDQSISQAEAAVREKPNDINARIQLADAYARAERYQDAIKQLDEVLKAQPDNRSALLGEGTLRYLAGDLKSATKYLDEFIKGQGTGEFAGQDPQLQRAYYFRGMVFLKDGKGKEAEADFDHALQIDGADADAWYGLGSARNTISKYADAAFAFNRALAFVPTGWCDPYRGLETAYKGTKNAQGVSYAAAMNKVCLGGGQGVAGDLKPLAAEAGDFQVVSLIGLGLAAENDHNLPAAAKWYQDAAKLEPTNEAIKAGIARTGIQPSVSPSAMPSASEGAK